jgi:predicted nucleic acid-binding protein
METKHIIQTTAREWEWKRLNRIEKATPDMLQALEAVVDYFEGQHSLLADQCRAALAKAKTQRV